MHAECPRTTVYVAIKRGMDAEGLILVRHNFLICIAIFGIKCYNSNTLLALYVRKHSPWQKYIYIRICTLISK